MTRRHPRSIDLGRISHGNRRQPRKYTLMNVVDTKQTDQSSRLIASGSTMIDLASKEKKSTRVFHVHKALLCFYSPYHDKLLNGYFVEGTIPCQQPIVQEVRAEILRLFFTWLYSGNVDLTLPKLDGSNTSYYWMIVTKFLPTTEVVSFAFCELKMCFKLLQILTSMLLVEIMCCKLWRYVILSIISQYFCFISLPRR